MQQEKGKVVSVQLVPTTCFKPEQPGLNFDRVYESDYDGATDKTNGYSVYLRYENGWVSHVETNPTEIEAIPVAKKMCDEHKVPLEPYPWQAAIFGIVQVTK
jgi:hypothetical protein